MEIREPGRHMQVPRLSHPFPVACLPPSVLPGEAPGILVLPSSALPPTGVRISHLTPKGSISSFLAHLGTSPRSSQLSRCTEISHQHFAAPWWLSEEKHVLLCSREAEGPMARVVSKIWPLASIPGSFQTSSDLLSTLVFLFSPTIVTSFGHCLPICRKTPMCHPPWSFLPVSEDRDTFSDTMLSFLGLTFPVHDEIRIKVIMTPELLPLSALCHLRWLRESACKV